MAKVQNWQCDACGRHKGVSNHWWQVKKVKTAESRSFEVEPFDAGSESEWLDVYCGEECLCKAVSRWLSEPVPQAERREFRGLPGAGWDVAPVSLVPDRSLCAGQE